MAPRKPTTAQVQEMAAKTARGPVRVAAPAWVLSYDRVTQTATIQIAIAYQVQDDAGEKLPRVRPPVANVPVQWSGSTTWDLEEGEWGTALICDRSIDEWKATGNQANVPRDPRRFDITDAVFLAGFVPPAAPLPSAAYAAGAVVLYDRGTGDVRLGDSTAIRAVVLETFLSAFGPIGAVGPLQEIIAGITLAGGATVELAALLVLLQGGAYKTSTVKAV